MGSTVKNVGGELFTVRDSKTVLDHIVEGPDIYHATATDTHGNTHEAGGRTQESAEDKAIFGVIRNRNET
jgi:hypothetical protein